MQKNRNGIITITYKNNKYSIKALKELGFNFVGTINKIDYSKKISKPIIFYKFQINRKDYMRKMSRIHFHEY